MTVVVNNTAQPCAWGAWFGNTFCEPIDPCNSITSQSQCTSDSTCSWDPSGDYDCSNPNLNSTCGTLTDQTTCEASTTTPGCRWVNLTEFFCTDPNPCLSVATSTQATCEAQSGQCYWDPLSNCQSGTRPPPTTTQTTTPFDTTTPTTTPFSCSAGEFQCTDANFCVAPASICNGVDDCPDGSDEDGPQCTTMSTTVGTTTPRPCNAWEYTCADGECVNNVQLNVQCNTTAECRDGSDETGCTSTTVPPQSPCVTAGTCSANEVALMETATSRPNLPSNCRQCYCNNNPSRHLIVCPDLMTPAPTAPTQPPTLNPTFAPTPADPCLSVCNSQFVVDRIRRLGRAEASDPAACRACIDCSTSTTPCNPPYSVSTWCQTGNNGGYPDNNDCVRLGFQTTMSPTNAPTRGPTPVPAPTTASPTIAEASSSGDGGGGMMPIIIIVVVVILLVGAIVFYRHKQKKNSENAKKAKRLAKSGQRGQGSHENPAYEQGQGGQRTAGGAAAAASGAAAGAGAGQSGNPPWADPNVPFTSRADAVAQLASRGNIDGDFVVRQSTKLPHGYIITSICKGVVANSQLKSAHGKLTYGGLAVGRTIQEAVNTLRHGVQIAPASGPPYNLSGAGSGLPPGGPPAPKQAFAAPAPRAAAAPQTGGGGGAGGGNPGYLDVTGLDDDDDADA
eukprot:m.101917 g.101917  ORF g.101917 m.101917 type:complete len:675 (+) comp10412_c0_seq1:1369-3393(+)